ncbi:MAG: hypothetical protein WDZ81_00775 [Candidatus Saccharimonadales bacterium]
MTAESIILAILAVFLMAFLIIAIVAGYYIIKIMRNLKKISDQAEGVGLNFIKVSKALRDNITPMAVAAGIIQFVKKIKK